MSAGSSPTVEKYKAELGGRVSEFIGKCVGDGLIPSTGSAALTIKGDDIRIDVDTKVLPFGEDSNGDMNVALEMAFTSTDERPANG